ncbi:MAG TPA: CBS domain-containing protein [Candidatus Saccharimonadales bacterium]|nr:CBS domain-containing protein [Candidatus Saccharimonadales bacterium]
MFIFLLISTVIFFIILLIVTAMRPTHSQLSEFELEHRVDIGDRNAKRVLAREKLLDDVTSLQRVVVALLMVIIGLLSVATLGWLVGILVALVVALEYGAIARLGLIRSLSQRLYNRVEKFTLSFIQKAPYVFSILRSAPMIDNNHGQRIGSRTELQHLIDESDDVLTPDEKKLIVNGLSFNDQLVSTIMTPRDMISSINKSEFLGPLTLNDLHKVGHSRLPVISGNIDHVVGILYLNSLLALDIKRSTTAEKAMDPKVFYIRDNQTLHHALAAFLRTHNHLFIVVNQSRETVGLLTLKDVIEALLGRKIIDEFDEHDNLNTVATRKSV